MSDVSSRAGQRPATGMKPLRVISALVLREMSTTYGKNPGGYIWAVLEPLGMIVILAFAFAFVMRSPSLGNSFILFYASGFIPFMFFNDLARVIGNGLNYSRSLLKYPGVGWIHALLARYILYVLTGFVVSAIILTGILIATDSSLRLHYSHMIVAMAAAGILGAGIGCTNAFITGVWPMWKTIWAIATRPLMIASAVLYVPEDLGRTAQDVLWYNPLVHVTTLFRKGVFVTYKPQDISPQYVFGIGIVLLAFGLLMLRRFHLKILEER